MNSKEIGKMESGKETELKSKVMETFILENGPMINDMEKGWKYLRTEQSIMDNGKTDKSMDLASRKKMEM